MTRSFPQTQFIRQPVPSPSAGSTAATRAWALDRLDESLTLTDLAAHAQISVRILTRRLRDEVGMSPGQWLAGERIERARHLLETTDWPVDLVARHAGFGTGTPCASICTARWAWHRRHTDARSGTPPC